MNYALLEGTESMTWEQAIKDDICKDAMIEEFSAFEKNKTWTLMELPSYRGEMNIQNKIQTRWEYGKVKSDISCERISTATWD